MISVEQAFALSDSISVSNPSFTPSVFPSTDPGINTMLEDNYGCYAGSGVEWSRRFPATKEGFLIKIVDSPTRE